MDQRPAQRRQRNRFVQHLIFVEQALHRDVLHGVFMHLEPALGRSRGDLHEFVDDLVGIALRGTRVVEHRQIDVFSQPEQSQVIAVVRGAVSHQRDRRIGPLRVVRLVLEGMPDAQRQRLALCGHAFQQRDIAFRRPSHVVDARQA